MWCGVAQSIHTYYTSNSKLPLLFSGLMWLFTMTNYDPDIFQVFSAVSLHFRETASLKKERKKKALSNLIHFSIKVKVVYLCLLLWASHLTGQLKIVPEL